MSSRIYSSLTRKLESLPDPPAPVGIYVCGITPYDSPHLGHARAAIVFDAFTRFLRHRGNAVTYIRNITDIDDKIIERAGDDQHDVGSVAGAKDGAGATELSREGGVARFSQRYIDEYHEMAAALGCLPPDKEPRVTEHIPEIIALIEKLVSAAAAYASGGSVYFSVRAFPRYGALSGRNIEDLISGSRVDPGEEKRDPLDFALWKAAKPGEPFWESPWGQGRPGWHIECSAMAMKYLGESFDIHGGGNDLIFPHHENEIAQSEAATGKTFARLWMHNGLITLKAQKMSKSLGNVLRVPELITNHSARVLRFYLLNAHFTSPLDFSEDRLRETKVSLDRFATFDIQSAAGSTAPLFGAPDRGAKNSVTSLITDFLAALEDNFNTARAISILFDAVSEGNKSDPATRAVIAEGIRRCGAILGLELFPPAHSDAEVERLISERNAARAARNFARSDEIRNVLSERGVIIEDTAQGTRWRR